MKEETILNLQEHRQRSKRRNTTQNRTEQNIGPNKDTTRETNTFLDQTRTPTAVSGVGSSPALATCEASQVLLAGVPGGFSRGSPVFAPPSDWPVSYELK